MVIVSAINGKGGVGKTTTICGLALTAASLGYRTLAVDLDDQGDLSASLLGSDFRSRQPSAYDWIKNASVPFEGVRQCIRENLDLLPASHALRQLDLELAAPFVLREAFDREQLPYDVLFIDTPGNISSPRLPMVLCASTAFYIPLELRAYSIDSLKATRQICDRVSGSRYYNPELRDLGWVSVKVDQVHRSGPHQGLPTKSDQRELYLALLEERGPELSLGILGRRDPFDHAFSRGRNIEELKDKSDNARLAREEFDGFAHTVFQKARLLRVVAEEKTGGSL